MKKIIFLIIILLFSSFVYATPKIILTVPQSKIIAGETFSVNVNIKNIEEAQLLDLTYILQDYDSEETIEILGSERFYIKKDMEKTKNFMLPQELLPKTYILKVKSLDNTIKASTSFDVIELKDYKKLLSIVLIIILILAIILTISIFSILNWPLLTKERIARIKLFFWSLNWKLRDHKYYIKYILIFIIIIIILILILIPI